MWLDGWLRENPEVTYDALASRIGGENGKSVTKSAITQWITAQKPIEIGLRKLLDLSRYTGKPLPELIGLVYGNELVSALGVGVADELERRVVKAFRTELDAAIRRLPPPPPRSGRGGA